MGGMADVDHRCRHGLGMLRPILALAGNNTRHKIGLGARLGRHLLARLFGFDQEIQAGRQYRQHQGKQQPDTPGWTGQRQHMVPLECLGIGWHEGVHLAFLLIYNV